jgi:DNA repair exonuclease SbcCD nuclease subunit
MNAMKEWTDVYIVDSGCSLQTPVGTFVFVPYTFPGKLQTALDIIDPKWKSARSIFCHQEFFGCNMGAIQSTEGDQWSNEFPLVISGHIHDKQRIGENIFYPGSSIQHAFGESGDKTITMCYFTETIRVESIDLDMPQKKIVYLSVVDAYSFQPTEKDRVRLTLNGTFEEFKAFKKSAVFKKCALCNVKIVFRPVKEAVNGEELTDTDFKSILYDMVVKENNPYMTELYTELIK